LSLGRQHEKIVLLDRVGETGEKFATVELDSTNRWISLKNPYRRIDSSPISEKIEFVDSMRSGWRVEIGFSLILMICAISHCFRGHAPCNFDEIPVPFANFPEFASSRNRFSFPLSLAIRKLLIEFLLNSVVAGLTVNILSGGRCRNFGILAIESVLKPKGFEIDSGGLSSFECFLRSNANDVWGKHSLQSISDFHILSLLIKRPRATIPSRGPRQF
jgi:hypothetical protein